MKAVHWIILSLVFIAAAWFIYKTRDNNPRAETLIDLNWKFIMGDHPGAEHPAFVGKGYDLIDIIAHQRLAAEECDLDRSHRTRLADDAHDFFRGQFILRSDTLQLHAAVHTLALAAVGDAYHHGNRRTRSDARRPLDGGRR